MAVRENNENDSSSLATALRGLEIPNNWLEQRTGTQVKTAPVDLSYLESIADLVRDPAPTPYAIWFPAFTSLYCRISHINHEGANKLWIAFLRKGMVSLNYLITHTTPEMIAAEVAKLVERKYGQIMRTPETYRSDAYWHSHSDAHKWYSNLERMLAADAGLTQKLIVELGEEMIELVCKPFEKTARTITAGTHEHDANRLLEAVLKDIEDARAVIAQEKDADTIERVRTRLLNIMTGLE